MGIKGVNVLIRNSIMSDLSVFGQPEYTARQVKQVFTTLCLTVGCLYKHLTYFRRTPVQKYPILVPMTIADFWLEIVTIVVDCLASEEKLPKGNLEEFVKAQMQQEDSTILEYLSLDNIKTLRHYVTRLRQEIEELNLPSSSQTQTTITSYTTAPTLTNPAGASALSLLPDISEKLDSETSYQMKSTPSSNITIVREKKPSTSKCVITKTPDLLIKLQITNLLEVPPLDLWDGKEMWRHKMVDMTAILNTKNPEQNEIGLEAQRIANSFLAIIQKKERILKQAERELEEGPSNKRARN
uniref:Nonstructural protein 1 n=1 Tax=Emberiza rustica parvoviridae sp. TaxID=2794478 RepID=A0A8A4XD79_9VIRU|nr:MAG: nonstructural protein 1 [Emberiza rustica parvoviridae sp.]